MVNSAKEEGHKIEITHEFTPGSETTSNADKNFDEKTKGEITYTGDNHGIGDSIDLYTPKVDDRGHVTGQNIETVTLPYGFKHITIGTQSTNTSAIETNTNKVTADNT